MKQPTKLPWEDVKVGDVVFRDGAYFTVLVSEANTKYDPQIGASPQWVVKLARLEGVALLSRCTEDTTFWDAVTGEGTPFDQWSMT